MLRPLESARYIEHGQHEKHKCLHAFAKQEKPIDGNCAQQGRHDEEEDYYNFLTAYIAK